MTIRSLKSPERALLLALLDEKKLTRGRNGWETRRRGFAFASGNAVIALGLAIELPPAELGARSTLILSDAGIEHARHERSRDLGRQADNLTEKAMA